jgi:hypothetical protein
MHHKNFKTAKTSAADLIDADASINSNQIDDDTL